MHFGISSSGAVDGKNALECQLHAGCSKLVFLLQGGSFWGDAEEIPVHLLNGWI